MNIFVQNVPPHITDKELRASLVKSLKDSGVIDFHCQHPRGKLFAFLTVLNISAGQRFLGDYGVSENAPRHSGSKKPLSCGGRLLRCQRSRNPPTELEIKALILEASERLAKAVVTVPPDSKHTREFAVSAVHCGMWDYDERSQLTFVAQFSLNKPGIIVFGKGEVIMLLGESGKEQVRMDVSYYSCDNIAINEDRSNSTLTFTLRHSPKFYKVGGGDFLEAALRALTLGPNAMPKPSIEKRRVLGFDDAHHKIAGACKIYQVRLSASNMIPRVRSLLQSSPKMPTQMSLITPFQYPKMTFEQAYRRLDNQLTDTALYGKLPFQIKFQMDRIARNGYLSSLRVIEMLPTVREVFEELKAETEKATEVVAHALRQLTRSLPVPGPDTYEQYTVDSLLAKFVDLTNSYDSNAPNNPYELVKKHQHINLVHRIVITPTKISLEGPDPEPTNRVLRKYPGHIDHFTRVVFCEEDGGSVRYEPKVSQRDIYDGRFRALLAKPIVIAGMAYDFFGFSHSALRSHSCWFMAAIPTGGSLFIASLVLKELGNFDKIRTPAKCAARIGQNFTVMILREWTD